MSAREDYIARTRGGTPPSKDPIKQRESAYRDMADRGIRSLSGRTTADDKGEIARDIQKDYLADRSNTEFTPYEDTLFNFGDVEGAITETAGDP